ncbi:MAG: ATP phosphoribosyltransferase regulatory subunit, partial [Pseudomonadota bacterium]
MVAESAENFDQLEAQAAQLVERFCVAGYEFVAPSIIQPADVFLDAVGEQLRNRTYVFTDPAGDELCLRPDVTIPAARLYRERYPTSDPKQRYCYNG